MSGEAISLVAAEDKENLAAVEKLIRRKLQVSELPRGDKAGRGGPARAARGVDPLFHQPYVSPDDTQRKPEPKPTLVPGLKGLGSQERKKKEKQIAALFLPPVSKTDA